MWDSPGKNTGVAYHALLQGIFPTQGTNLCLLRLLHCRQILYCWATWEALYWRALNITMKFCTRHLDYLHAKLLQNVNKLIDHMLGRTVSLSVNHPSPHRKQNCEVKWKLFSRVWLFATRGLCSPWNSPGQNTGVGRLSLLYGIRPRSPMLQVDCFSAEPQGKQKVRSESVYFLFLFFL